VECIWGIYLTNVFDAKPGAAVVVILRGDVTPHLVYAEPTKGRPVMIRQKFIALGLVTIAASSLACAERATVRVREPVVTETVAVPVAPVVTEKVVVAQPVVPVVTERVVVAQPVVSERVVVAHPVVTEKVVTEKVVIKKPVVKETVVIH
jgi:hypothetical protein